MWDFNIFLKFETIFCGFFLEENKWRHWTAVKVSHLLYVLFIVFKNKLINTTAIVSSIVRLIYLLYLSVIRLFIRLRRKFLNLTNKKKEQPITNIKHQSHTYCVIEWMLFRFFPIFFSSTEKGSHEWINVNK